MPACQMPAGPMPAAPEPLVHPRNRHRVPKVGSGGEGDRTPDLVNAIHALSQLSYAPHSPASLTSPAHYDRHVHGQHIALSGASLQSTTCSTASDAAHTD